MGLMDPYRHRTAPWLRPSRGCPVMPIHLTLYMAFVMALVGICSSRPLLVMVQAVAQAISVQQVAATVVIMLVYLFVYGLCLLYLRSPHLLRPFLRPLQGYRRIYHRSHIFHMRLDRLRRLVHLHSRLAISSSPSAAPLSPGVSLFAPPRVRLYGGGSSPTRPGGSKDHTLDTAAALAWLSSLILSDDFDNLDLDAADRVEECREQLSRLPPQGQVEGVVPQHRLSSTQLASLLGDSWLDDEVVNAGCRFVIHHAAQPHIALADTLHVKVLGNAKAPPGSDSYSARTPLDHSILSGSTTVVFLPLHVFGNHWTLLRLNISNLTYSYADCLHPNNSTPPEDQFQLVVWWLSGLGIDFSNAAPVPFEVPLPRQLDSHSCGVIVLSLMATLLLKYEMWAPYRAGVERMLWFLRLSPPIEDDDAALLELVDVSDDDDDDGTMDTDHHESHCSSSDSPPSSSPSHSSLSLPSCSPPHPPSSSFLKRKTKPSSSFSNILNIDSDNELSDSAEGRGLKRRAGPKPNSSWAYQKSLKERSKEEEFKANHKKTENFRAKILKIDAHAQFDADDHCSVRCSACGSWVQMRSLYDTVRFTEHRKSGRCRSHQATGMISASLTSMGFLRTKGKSDKGIICMVSVPCPGLTRESDARVNRYLSRTMATTGGAPSRPSLARALFGKGWKRLSPEEKRAVFRREASLAAWKVTHGLSAVYSTKCEEMVYAPVNQEPSPCSHCKDLLDLHGFQVALRRPMPSEDSMKHVPKAHRCSQTGELFLKIKGLRRLLEEDDGTSPLQRFAKGVLSGEFKDKGCEVMLGMIEAMAIQAKRIGAGKSLRNMRYSAGFSDFCDVLCSLSPVAYRTFKRHFGGPTMETLRRLRAKRTRFQPGFSPTNVAAAAETLKQYNYHGPLALAWDDTELEPAISIYQESKDVCLVVGGAGGVLRVEGTDDIDAVLEQARLEKATKLRIWLLIIPLPKIPPILIAAVARGSSVTSPELKVMHDQVVNLLHSHNLFPVSGSSDGTESERSLQHLVSESADTHRGYSIPNSHLGPIGTITLNIPLMLSKYPFVLIQDSKHGLKTARNQILTGARHLVIGNDSLHYQQVRDTAAHPAGPLFVRDVERLDRQDDRAAARFFSAAMLDFQLKNFPAQRALSVYLFVLGELIDAWQNRHISHLERAKMVMRARFFLMAWRSHIIAHPDHSLHIQFISRESFDIFITLCDSLLSLIIVYRRWYPTYPLLPWLHSTEPCEHVFGIIRQIKHDFTYSDVLAIERKLFVLLSGSFKDLTAEEKANQTAAGYHHTYFHTNDLDVRELVCYPTDQALQSASNAASQEVTQLLSSLGISAVDMLSQYKAPVRHQPSTSPSPPLHRQTIASNLALFDNTWKETSVEESIIACEFAIAADNAAQTQAIHDLPDASEENMVEARSLLETLLLALAVESVPVKTLEVDAKAPLTFSVDGSNLEVSSLVTQRIRHQPTSTSKAVRQRSQGSVLLGMNTRTFERYCESGPTLREELTIKLQALTTSSTRSSLSGVTRQIRHTGTFGDQSTTTQEKNKAIIRSSTATTFLYMREPAFSSFRGVHENFHLANITEFNPLSPGHFVIAVSSVSGRLQVLLGEVVTMYSKGNGKNSKHEWVANISNLGKASYIYVRKFAPMAGHSVFTSLDCQDLSSPTYLQIPSTHLIFSLASFSPSITRQDIAVNGTTFTLVTLCAGSSSLFTDFHGRQDELYSCVNDFKQRVASHGRASGDLD